MVLLGLFVVVMETPWEMSSVVISSPPSCRSLGRLQTVTFELVYAGNLIRVGLHMISLKLGCGFYEGTGFS